MSFTETVKSLGDMLKWVLGLGVFLALVYLYAIGVIKAEMVPQAFEWLKGLTH